MMSSDAALQAYELFKELGLTKEEDKHQVLMELAKVRSDITVIKTSRTKEKVLQDYAKRYKILNIKGKENE